MDEGTRLRLEYDNGSELLRGLTETRFRLLALVPTLSGAVVALLSGNRTDVELLAIGLLGLCASVGILLYELRNGEIHGSVARRVAELERTLLAHGPLVDVPRHGCSESYRSRAPRASRWSTALRSAAGATSSRGARCEPQASRAARGPAALRSAPSSGSSSRSRSSGSSARAAEPTDLFRGPPRNSGVSEGGSHAQARARSYRCRRRFAAPVAYADGPSLVSQGGAGAAGRGAVHWVTVSDGTKATLLEKLNERPGGLLVQARGSLGNPVDRDGAGALRRRSDARPRFARAASLDAEQVPRDRRQAHARRPDDHPRRELHVRCALASTASRMYLIEYTQGASSNLTHYVVRGYDMRRRPPPGKIVARSEDDEKTMTGYAITRTTSATGRWVYTLYQKPSGELFIHALDTTRGVAYCIDLPANKALYNIASRSATAAGRSPRTGAAVVLG